MFAILTVSNLIPLASVDLFSSRLIELVTKCSSTEQLDRVNSWFSAEYDCSLICCRRCPDSLVHWAKERGLEFLGIVVDSGAKRFVRELNKCGSVQNVVDDIAIAYNLAGEFGAQELHEAVQTLLEIAKIELESEDSFSLVFFNQPFD